MVGLLLFTTLLVSCEPPPQVSIATDAPRIVSLSPAISRTLIDLGMEPYIVGRTPFCDSLDPSIPIVGDLLDLNVEQLIRVNPTHVYVQPPASGMDSRLGRLAEERLWTLGAWHLNDVVDIAHLIGDLPPRTFEEGTPELDASLARAQAILKRIEDVIVAPRDGVFDGRTMLIVGLDPVTVFGSGTYLGEILGSVGGVNAVDMDGYPQLTLEDVTRLNPEAIILVRPGAVEGTLAMDAAGPLARLDVAALRDGRVALLTHKDAFLPSSALPEVAEALRAILRRFGEGGGT
ncbi:MAG TPA: hypothetical protein PK400_05720 [Phycisphaerales bacterium]|nr:hypothetical protein [Phycisphaerales bacterium]